MARHIKGNSIGKKSLLFELVSLPGIVHRSLALFISVLLLSESVAAAPRRMGVSIAQQPAATEQDATRAAAKRAYQEGEQLLNQGTAESKRQAIAKCEEALSLYRAVGERVLEAVTLNRIGAIYTTLGEAQEALKYYDQGLSLIREVGNNQSLEAIILYNIGSLYFGLGEKQKALDSFNQAWQLYQAAQAVGDPKHKATLLYNIGSLYSELGENQKALSAFNQVLTFYREVGNREGVADTLSDIGAIYYTTGENQKALDSYKQALQLYGAEGNGASVANTFNLIGHIGEIYLVQQDWQQALSSFNQALTFYQKIGNREREADLLSNIGVVYSYIGEKQKALDSYNQALQLYKDKGNPYGVARTLYSIASTCDLLTEKGKALSYYNSALTISRGVGYHRLEGYALNGIGFVYYASGEIDKALDYYNGSLLFQRSFGNKRGIATALNNIGLVYSFVGKTEEALNYYNQALPLVRESSYRIGEALTLSNIAKVESNRSNLKAALTHMEAAIQIFENLRTKVASQEFRASYFASVQDYYQFYIDLLMQLHKTNPSKGYDALALNASESARARNLLEILTEARADIRQRVDPKLREQERTLQQQVDALDYRQHQLLNTQHGKKETEELSAIPKQIESLLGQLNDVQAQIRQKNPTYAALTQPGAFTLNLQQIQQQVLDDNTLLVEYSLGKERSYLWAVTKTGITSYELPKRADIEAAAQEFYKQLSSDEDVNPEVGMKLSQMLLAPVANQLGNKRLLIVSDGKLQMIPFAALPIPENAKVSVLPAPRPEINLRANSSSRLKTTQTSINSPLERTSAMSQGFEPLADAASPPVSPTPLLVQNEIVSLPSASTIAVLRSDFKNRQPAPKTLAVLADPVFSRDDIRFQKPPEQTSVCQPVTFPQQPSPLAGNIPADLKRSLSQIGTHLDRLPYSRCEAQQILNLVPATQREQALDFAASRATATSPDLAQYRLVHLATHGLLNPVHPELSGVVMSLVDEKGTDTDGFLRLNDIYNLNLPAELIVLSACETGLVTNEQGELKEIPGEGLVGLTRGFMYAGAKRVVVSLWSVNDRATAELMTKFYQQMLSKGISPVAALRAAQLEMWNSKQWKNPYKWAAFVIQGEWQ